LLELMDKHNISWPFHHPLNYHTGIPWSDFINEKNKEKANPEAIDLLSQMLVVDFVTFN